MKVGNNSFDKKIPTNKYDMKLDSIVTDKNFI